MTRLRFLLGTCIIHLLGCGHSPTVPVCMAGASLDGDECEMQQAPIHSIPFPAGFEARVVQGFHGYSSHKAEHSHSVDFRCSEGAPVAASADGRVIAIKEDSDKGCNDPSCANDGNYVLLDHGEGVYSEYYHLRHLGALVEPGETVCRGQVIAVCGNTGYSSGPHLHFGVLDASRRTIPVQFSEARDTHGFGFPIDGTTYVSQNEKTSDCDVPEPSDLPIAAFAHQGVLLDTPFPLVFSEGDEPRQVSGRYYGDHGGVAIHIKHQSAKDWTTRCVSINNRGDFVFDLSWPHEQYPGGVYWFMITGSTIEPTGTCTSPGWGWSFKFDYERETEIPDGMTYRDWVESLRQTPKNPEGPVP